MISDGTPRDDLSATQVTPETSAVRSAPDGVEPDLSAPPEVRGWRGYAPIILVGLLGFLASLLVFSKIDELERQRQRDRFSEAARDRLLVIQREVDYSLGVVEDIGGFFDASRRVSRRQFREFVGPALRRNQGAQAFQWVPRVANDEHQAFVERARRSFSPFEITELRADGTIGPAVPRSVHFPVLYVQPYPQNKSVLGLDLASDGEQYAILRAAAQARAPRATVPTRVATETGEQAGFTVYLPVYQRVTDEVTDDEDAPPAPDGWKDPAHLRGFAIGLFLVSTLVEQALESLGPSGVDVRFFGSEDAVTERPFYVHNSRVRRGRSMLSDAVEGGGRWEYRGEIQVADRRWTVVCSPVPGNFEQDSWSAYLLLGGGIAFTLLILAFLVTSRGRAEEVRRLVAQRTVQLERSNTALNKEIAERRRAERALQLLNVTLEHRVARRTAEAERRARELEQFAYVASHDLKAPLRAISNLAGWLKDDLRGKLTAQTSEQIELLRDRVARMHALVEGLLAYSRIGRSAGTVEEVDTAELVADAIDSLAPPRGFKVKVQSEMPVLRTDKLHLGQVFANLIGNAINHHDRKKGIILVSGTELADQYEFTVTDDGPGIPTEYQDKVFMMFQTLKVKDFGGDTGIGLALVKKLVEEHGGNIRLESGPERGCRFSFSWAKQDTDVEPRYKQGPNAGRGSQR